MIVEIDTADDVRLEPYRFIRERDLAGRGDRFIAEGKVVLSCLAGSQDFRADSLLILKSRLDGLSAQLDAFPPTLPVYVAGQHIMDGIAGFHVHRGILASGVRVRRRPMADLVSNAPANALIVVLSGISNHDNVGGIFRNAAAFGADALLLDDQCCNPLYRKALRVSVGGVLTVPWAIGGPVATIAERLLEADYSLCALSTSGAKDVQMIPATGKRALFLGSEGHGLPPTVIETMETYKIPMPGGFDSLNVSTASGIAMMLASA
jgi:tRNA G18 (ribose-2'-O)-methylase SpoU